ncbi:hypothetical protein CW751_11240 [Brumimicrobium salinarum]|uniref:Secretion system C-terminal sorting domain-containing protein n=1 Tax=Brumimicrobium salinarum TaxID=2058658 RepID=A0A2I0R0X2_9FLAO|nr:T9SS type A sorting domain-containing protein [Brumimicrobium salinarum]PKR80228.1 hypothetical protein CW751_11240 [Brumimicrobium salinarum]
MKLLNLILFICSLFVYQSIKSQQNQYVLNGNKVAATVNDVGRLFNNPSTASAGYEIPAGSSNHLIYSGGFWFGGTNQNADLKLAATLYGVGKDFNPGPYSSTNDYYDTAYIYNYESAIWKVKKSDIIYHIDNYNQAGYVAPNGIADWPGNGNASIGVAAQLAPYVDLNNNGIYEPHKGEYPCIKGDEAVYQIMNDDRLHTESDGERIGAEIHIMLYHIEASNFINSTTFIDVKVFNRGQNSFTDFKASILLDPDVGFSEDDLIGSSPSKNLMYAYNGLNYDPGQHGAPGYDNTPPAVGIVSLNRNFEYFGYYNRSDFAGPQNGRPHTSQDYWNYMNGRWLDGSDWVIGGSGLPGSLGATSLPTKHVYDGNPYLGTGWTELNIDGNGTQNPAGDRRFFVTTVEESFAPGDVLTYNYAIIAEDYTSNLENVNRLIGYADSVQQYFDTTNLACNQSGTGVADDFDLTPDNHRLNFEITRLDGEGNMSRSVKIDPNTEQRILDNNFVEKVKYKRGYGPIDVRLTDTVNHAEGHFVLKFREYDSHIDTANWTVYHYDTIGGSLIDSVNSAAAINVGGEQIISQWGMAIKIKQENYFCFDGAYTCPTSSLVAKPLETTLSFEDNNNNWLTGVRNTNGLAPINWIMSGVFNGAAIPGDSIHNPACYNSAFVDQENLFTNLADGIVSPGNLARYSDCDLTPLAISSSVASNSIFNALVTMDLSTAYQPSVDIVFTSDTSKWTRSPVIELNKNDLTSLDGGKAGFLRKSNSVDKQGNPDGTGTGMGWFPGYAIDVETGRRLNIAFCENSTMIDDNGDDMIWNPSERLMDNNGNYVLGGQHTIYVFGSEKHDMPNYDEGEYIRQELSLETVSGFRNVYENLSWVMQPLLRPGKQLNASDARLEVRINKEFKTRILSNQNDGKPMFSWDAIPYDEVAASSSFELYEGEVNVYPNPAQDQLNIMWSGIKVEEITILSFQGNLIKQIPIVGEEEKVQFTIDHLSSGVYFVKVGNIVRKLIVN